MRKIIGGGGYNFDMGEIITKRLRVGENASEGLNYLHPRQVKKYVAMSTGENIEARVNLRKNQLVLEKEKGRRVINLAGGIFEETIDNGRRRLTRLDDGLVTPW